jgi:hypothetical protein
LSFDVAVRVNDWLKDGGLTNEAGAADPEDGIATSAAATTARALENLFI